MPCILGFVRQLQKLRMKAGVRETEVKVTLIARRSRYRVGTRHWRRGVDNQGFVANFVESEQIVEAGTGEISSFVQVRGSIPVPWSHVRLLLSFSDVFAALAPSVCVGSRRLTPLALHGVGWHV